MCEEVIIEEICEMPPVEAFLQSSNREITWY